MVSTVRTGPAFLVLGTRRFTALKAFLQEHLAGRSMDLNEALEEGREDSTIVFLTSPGLSHTRLDDVKGIILIQDSRDQVFASLLNRGGTQLIQDAHVAPGNLVMRLIGNHDKIISKVQEYYQAERMLLQDCIDQGRSEQSIIYFSSAPLHHKLSLQDMHPEGLLVDQRPSVVYRELRAHALRYLAEGLEETDWYDVQIRIYDTFSAYELHYERLQLILDSLEMGMVLGEIWTRDYARLMMSVVVYQVRLLTFLNPLEVKKLLLGMEYLENGGRIVDYDLYYKNKKISWPEVVKKPHKNKKEASWFYREDILARLTPAEKERLRIIEERILDSRK